MKLRSIETLCITKLILLQYNKKISQYSIFNMMNLSKENT